MPRTYTDTAIADLSPNLSTKGQIVHSLKLDGCAVGTGKMKLGALRGYARDVIAARAAGVAGQIRPLTVAQQIEQAAHDANVDAEIAQPEADLVAAGDVAAAASAAAADIVIDAPAGCPAAVAAMDAVNAANIAESNAISAAAAARDDAPKIGKRAAAAAEKNAAADAAIAMLVAIGSADLDTLRAFSGSLRIRARMMTPSGWKTGESAGRPACWNPLYTASVRAGVLATFDSESKLVTFAQLDDEAANEQRRSLAAGIERYSPSRKTAAKRKAAAESSPSGDADEPAAK